jgi:iron complex transport system ATP-binding protein
VIAFERVAIRYPRATRAAVEDVSFTAGRSLITAVVGPNGSGKSTLVRALLGRQPLERGSITIDSASLGSIASRDFARRVAVVPQREEPVFPHGVRDFVALGRYPHGSAWSGFTSRDEAAIDSALDRAGVAELAGRSTDELSGGEWQRARIARALAQETQGIVLDEPTTFLDVAHEMAMFELLDRLARDGCAVLLVSHQLNLVARFAHRIILLDRGNVAASGTPDEVMRGEILERVYDWPLVVTRDPAVGAPALLPLRRGSRQPRSRQ